LRFRAFGGADRCWMLEIQSGAPEIYRPKSGGSTRRCIVRCLSIRGSAYRIRHAPVDRFRG
jgi:hypothetical protein